LATLFLVRNFFPAEKKVRHSIRADYAVGDDTFVRTMGHLLGPPLVEGNKITPLENGDQIFPAMLNGIRSAKRSITFENFLFREAWRYRNWVIAAVNADLPFNRFLTEQLAGDLLPFDSIEQRDRQSVVSEWSSPAGCDG
jgi:hypothetical protein